MIETSGVDKIISLLAVVLHTRDIKYKVLNMFASYLTTLYTHSYTTSTSFISSSSCFARGKYNENIKT